MHQHTLADRAWSCGKQLALTSYRCYCFGLFAPFPSLFSQQWHASPPPWLPVRLVPPDQSDELLQKSNNYHHEGEASCHGCVRSSYIRCLETLCHEIQQQPLRLPCL